MALWNRAGTYYVKLTAPDGALIRRSTGTSDRLKAEEYHDKLKAELWDLARLKIKPKRTWDEAALRWLQEKKHKKSTGTTCRGSGGSPSTCVARRWTR